MPPPYSGARNKPGKKPEEYTALYPEDTTLMCSAVITSDSNLIIHRSVYVLLFVRMFERFLPLRQGERLKVLEAAM
jgi:hypothetical protein